jgi:hypothetical protein
MVVIRCAIAVALVDKIGRAMRAEELAWGFGRVRQAAATTIPIIRMVGLPRR